MTSSELIKVKVSIPVREGKILKSFRLHPDLLEDANALGLIVSKEIKQAINAYK